jgi:hypothetical protein
VGRQLSVDSSEIYGPSRCELFSKAYDHISERIDQVYKDLTKGKASPMGGVAYLSLEDSDVCNLRKVSSSVYLIICLVGTLCCWDQVSRDAANETFSRYGAVIWW